jgi:two-component sensor histidine kinase
LKQAGLDAAASDVAGKLQTLLIAELHHRVKNLLSMVLSITSQTLRVAPSLEAAREAIQSRIMILSRSFDLLVLGELDAAPLSSVIENAAEPYNETQRIAVSVPRVGVAALPALSVALVINELCTNAVKYGALSGGMGRVDVSGSIGGETLSLVWSETGGPPVRAPLASGFGTRLISSVIPEAVVTIDYPVSGVVCHLLIPLATLGGGEQAS